MTVTLRITAQYYENYNTSGEGAPYWKPKGGHEFEVEVADSLAMYADVKEELIPTIEVFLAGESNSMARFEYRDHEFVFSKPTQLDSEAFNASLDELMCFLRK